MPWTVSSESPSAQLPKTPTLHINLHYMTSSMAHTGTLSRCPSPTQHPADIPGTTPTRIFKKPTASSAASSYIDPSTTPIPRRIWSNITTNRKSYCSSVAGTTGPHPRFLHGLTRPTTLDTKYVMSCFIPPHLHELTLCSLLQTRFLSMASVPTTAPT